MDGKRLLPLVSLAGALIASPVFALDCCIVLNDTANVTSASKPEDVKECRPMTFGDCNVFRQNNTTLKTEYRAKECAKLDFCGQKQPDGCCTVSRDGKPISCTPSPDSIACNSFADTFRSEVQKEGGDRYDYSASYVGGKTCDAIPECANLADDPRTGAKAPPTAAAAEPEIRNVTPAIPVLGVPIPGLPSFEAPGGSYGAGYAIPWIAQYISALYSWVLATVITLAIAMTVWGGAKWLTAGGDTSRVSSAKTTIVNAVTGLLLALGTYLLLWTLNPAILQFKALQISTVEQILVKPDPANENTMSSANADEAGRDSAGSASGGAWNPAEPAPTGPEGTTPAFKQAGGAWGTKIYGDPDDEECKRQMSCSPGSSCTITCSGAQISLTNPPQYAWAGCGPTSAAMVANFFGKKVTPEYVGTWQGKNRKRVCGCGGTPDINGLFPDLKIRSTTGADALAVLASGKPVIFSTGPYKELGGCFSSGQHFMVASGVSGDWVEVNDPSTCGRKDGTGTHPDQLVVAKSAPFGITRMTRDLFLKGASFFVMEKK